MAPRATAKKIRILSATYKQTTMTRSDLCECHRQSAVMHACISAA